MAPKIKPSDGATIVPNLGLYYDRPPLGLSPQMLAEGLNFRIRDGKLSNLNLGWDQFEDFTLNGPVLLINNFRIRGGAEQLVFATKTDLYNWNGSALAYITPVYATGTVTVAGDGIDEAGANLGDMTAGGGINAAFDTTTAQAAAACASTASSTTAWVGRDLTTPSTIAGVTVHGSNDAGYVAGANPSVTITLYGKTGAAPASSTDGTVLGSITFTDTADESTGRVITSNDITTTWDNVWIKVDQGGAAAAMHVAEVLMFDPDVDVVGSGTNWDPMTKAGDFIAFGSATENDPDADWYEIASVTNDTNLVLVAPGAPKYPASTAYTIRRTFTGEENNIWTSVIFLGVGTEDDLWIASNGVDDLVTWNATDDFATLQESFTITKIKALAIYNNMVIYGGFEQAGQSHPNDIINSVPGDPLEITTGLAEQFKVHANPDGINSMRNLGDNLVIYSPRTLVLAQFVGDPLVFIFRTASQGTGPISPNAIADYGDRHEFLGFDIQYRFDGVALSETGYNVFREVIRRNDPLRRHFALAHFDEENGDLIWLIALQSDAGAGDETMAPEQAWTQHYLEDTPETTDFCCSRRQLPFISSGYYFRQDGLTWDEITEAWTDLNFRWNDQFFASAFPLNLFGGTDGKVYTINTSQNKADGTGLESFVRFGKRAVGDTRMRGLVRRIYPYVDQFQNDLNVTTYLSDHASGPATITDTQAFDQSLPEGGHFVSPFRRGRFMQVEFGTDGPSEPWSLEGYDVQVDPGGYR